MSLQFGTPVPGRDYYERAATFGILVRDGRLACVRVQRDGEDYHDLPGGAVEAGESETQALEREFLEETGLLVRPIERIVNAGQVFFKSDGAAVNNLGGIWTVEQLAEDAAAKIEADHTLVWLTPAEAMVALRHEAHAWAVLAWHRKRDSSEPRPV